MSLYISIFVHLCNGETNGDCKYFKKTHIHSGMVPDDTVHSICIDNLKQHLFYGGVSEPEESAEAVWGDFEGVGKGRINGVVSWDDV